MSSQELHFRGRSLFDNYEKRCPVSGESFAEEVANALTHGAGFVASAIGLVAMAFASWEHESTLFMLACIIFGSALTLLYAVSTLYHCSYCPDTKRLFRTLDHVCIYLVIAGSYTPLTVGPLYGTLGWTLFGVVWGVALVGIWYKVVAPVESSLPSTLSYLFLGWMSVSVALPLYHSMTTGALIWLAAGGLSYTVGVFFFLAERMPFSHAIWHLFVLGGSTCHFAMIYFHVLPHC